jgi:tetratricopeptide (TPR) repeat protein
MQVSTVLGQSDLKRLWNVIKLPPPVPYREGEYVPPLDHTGPPRRLWNAIKPPPALHGISKEAGLCRRRVLLAAVAMMALGGAAWGVHLHITNAPSRAESVFQDGMRLMGARDFRGAVACFSEAVRIWPQLATGFLERGLAFKGMRQLNPAIEDFQRAIHQNFKLGSAHMALGEAYREQGNLTGAMNEFTLTINLESKLDAFYQRGQIHELLGEHRQAIQDYDEAIQEQPDAPNVYRARATSRDGMGDRDGADRDRRKAVAIEHVP